MRKLILLLAIITMMPNASKAQIWNGNSIEHPGILYHSEDETTNLNTVYLVNVGALRSNDPNKFINVGGHWGVEASCFEIGMPVFLLQHNETDVKTGKKFIEILVNNFSDGINNRLGYVYKSEQGNQDDIGLMGDRPREGNDTNTSPTKFLFMPIDATTYNICMYDSENKTFYFVRNKDGNRKDLVEFKAHDPNDPDAQWKIVTRQDLIDDFNKTPANYDSPADATFFIYDQGLGRNNGQENKWNNTEGHAFRGLSVTDGTSKADHLITPDEISSGYTSDNVGTYTFYDALYGRFYNGHIKQGKGKYGQKTLPVSKTGWYAVSCQGFFKPGDNSDKQNAYLYAYVDNAEENSPRNVKTRLPLINSLEMFSGKLPKNETESGILFSENSHNYRTKVLIYLHEGENINIGVEVTETINNDDWAAFDNFQLKYLGDDFLLDEDKTSTNYFENHTYSTLIFKRTFPLNEWAPLVMPVNLNKEQIQTAFGNDVKLAALEKLSENGNTIIFKNISLNNLEITATAIEKAKPYLIKVSKPGRIGEYTLTNNQGIVTNNYYIIPSVSQNKEDKNPEELIGNNNANQRVTTISTYINRDGSTSENAKIDGSESNYTYAFKGGELYRYNRPFTLKGFRYALRFNESLPNQVQIVVEENNSNETTTIKAIEKERMTESHQNIFNLEGQKMPACKNLPKGIYISNGRKILLGD